MLKFSKWKEASGTLPPAFFRLGGYMEYYEWGRIVRPHGIKGYVQIDTALNEKSFASKVKTVYFLSDGQYEPINVQSVFIKNTDVCILLSICHDRNEAEALKGKSVFLQKGEPELPTQINLVEDLIGSKIYAKQTDRILGTLLSVDSYPRHDVYTIQTPNGTVLVPALFAVFPRIDPEKKIIYTDETRFMETAMKQED